MCTRNCAERVMLHKYRRAAFARRLAANNGRSLACVVRFVGATLDADAVATHTQTTRETLQVTSELRRRTMRRPTLTCCWQRRRRQRRRRPKRCRVRFARAQSKSDNTQTGVTRHNYRSHDLCARATLVDVDVVVVDAGADADAAPTRDSSCKSHNSHR